eukprot:scaffold66892_cov57-Phaeocystis_antarctica.AAC.3
MEVGDGLVRAAFGHRRCSLYRVYSRGAVCGFLEYKSGAERAAWLGRRISQDSRDTVQICEIRLQFRAANGPTAIPLPPILVQLRKGAHGEAR